MSAGEDVVVRLAHRAWLLELGASEEGCVAAGHAWVADEGREGGMICLICAVVRRGAPSAQAL